MDEVGALYALQLRLSPVEAGELRLNTGAPAQAAFLDLLRQVDPELTARLHAADLRRPYTLGLLRGFDHLDARTRAEVMAGARALPVTPGAVFWLRVTILDAELFQSFTRAMLEHAGSLIMRIGGARFAVTRVLGMPEPGERGPSWVGHATFADLLADRTPTRQWRFEFATPTAFSLGQRAWGKAFALFPDPGQVWRSLARMWETFAPAQLSMAAMALTPRDLAEFCDEALVVTRYQLETQYLPGARFGQAGFQGTVEYTLMHDLQAPAAQWLAPLARFALYAGVGYKTSMGMGQTRWLPGTARRETEDASQPSATQSQILAEER